MAARGTSRSFTQTCHRPRDTLHRSPPCPVPSSPTASFSLLPASCPPFILSTRREKTPGQAVRSCRRADPPAPHTAGMAGLHRHRGGHVPCGCRASRDLHALPARLVCASLDNVRTGLLYNILWNPEVYSMFRSSKLHSRKDVPKHVAFIINHTSPLQSLLVPPPCCTHH